MSHTLRLLLVSSSVLLSIEAVAQPDTLRHAVGDPQVRAQVSEAVRAIYDGVDTWVFALTHDNVLTMEGAEGTELQGGLVDGRLQRIIAKTWTDRGMYGAEFYLSADTLVHVYETFEFFQEVAPPDAWLNFKGLPSWERRSYFEGGEIGYSEVTGVGIEHLDDQGHHLQETARRLLGRLQTAREE